MGKTWIFVLVGLHRYIVFAAVTVSIILTAVDARLCYFKEQGDFKPSTPGIANRPAQLDRDELEHHFQGERGSDGRPSAPSFSIQHNRALAMFL